MVKWLDQRMQEVPLPELLRTGEYLVCFDRGKIGALWGVLISPDREAISAKYPELTIWAELPSWMDSEEVRHMREAPLWLDDDPPQGLLGVLLAERDRD